MRRAFYSVGLEVHTLNGLKNKAQSVTGVTKTSHLSFYLEVIIAVIKRRKECRI